MEVRAGDAAPGGKPKTLEDMKNEDELIAKAKAGKLAEKAGGRQRPGVRTFNVYVGEEVYKIGVEATGGVTAKRSSHTARRRPLPRRRPGSGKAPQRPVEVKAPRRRQSQETTIMAPMPGIIIRYEVKVGDEVKADDTVARPGGDEDGEQHRHPGERAGSKSSTSKPGTTWRGMTVLAVIG